MPFREIRASNAKIPICGDCGGGAYAGFLCRKPSTIPMKTLTRHFLDYLLVVALLALMLLVVASSSSVGSWLAVSGN